MRIPEDSGGWQKLYVEDVAAAENELTLKHFEIDRNDVLGDIYVLPSHHHQTFYAKLVTGRFFKIISVKPIQNSVWFSDPVYDYSISEAKHFEDHPKRHGRLICHAGLIDKRFIAKVNDAISLLAEHQSEDAVILSEDATLTVIRLFDKGKVIRFICYTDASKLVYKNGEENPEAVDFLNNLYLEVEKIVGIGE